MKKMMMFGALAVLGGALLVGCASTPELSPADEAIVKDWRDNTQLLIETSDPDLSAECKSGIEEVDALANTVTPIARSVSLLIANKLRLTMAENAYADYSAWLGTNPKADAATRLRMAKRYCFEIGLALSSTEETLNDNVLKYLAYDKLQNPENGKSTNEAAWDDFFAKNGSAEVDMWAKALVDNWVAEKPDAFFKAINVKAGDYSKALPKLQKWVTDISTAAARITAITSNSDTAKVLAAASFGKSVVDGISGKETVAAVNRLRKQITITGKLLPWLIDDITGREGGI